MVGRPLRGVSSSCERGPTVGRVATGVGEATCAVRTLRLGDAVDGDGGGSLDRWVSHHATPMSTTPSASTNQGGTQEGRGAEGVGIRARMT